MSLKIRKKVQSNSQTDLSLPFARVDLTKVLEVEATQIANIMEEEAQVEAKEEEAPEELRVNKSSARKAAEALLRICTTRTKSTNSLIWSPEPEWRKTTLYCKLFNLSNRDHLLNCHLNVVIYSKLFPDYI
jgi:hypothetical protein